MTKAFELRARINITDFASNGEIDLGVGLVSKDLLKVHEMLKTIERFKLIVLRSTLAYRRTGFVDERIGELKADDGLRGDVLQTAEAAAARGVLLGVQPL